MRKHAPLRTRFAAMLVAALRAPALRPVALAAALALGASDVAAQTIDAGMSREEVVARLGRPVGERTSGPRTYLFYRNGCEQSCGMHDLVVLEGDAVVDAIFRKSGRRYSGESSSPVAVPPRRGAGGAGGARAAGGERGGNGRARVQGGERVSLPPGTRRGGIVVGGDAGGAEAGPADAAPARRTVRGVAGAPAAAGQSDTAPDAARPRPQAGGDVRVPIVPRDTQLGVQPRERGKRTLPGPVTVPTTPRDTQVARPDTGRRPQPAPRPQPPAGTAGATSTANPTPTSFPR